ncbi:MAG: hypothetical protein HIU82_13390 [Proteobacteria bacterium]|nr:hypothetical protein [Pseudomonadota bacterium]
MPEPKAALTRQFLTWIATARPTDTAVLNAWPSSCPRLAIWEDALADGLVAFDGSRARHVVLTEAGRRIVAPAAEALLPERV